MMSRVLAVLGLWVALIFIGLTYVAVKAGDGVRSQYCIVAEKYQRTYQDSMRYELRCLPQ